MAGLSKQSGNSVYSIPLFTDPVTLVSLYLDIVHYKLNHALYTMYTICRKSCPFPQLFTVKKTFIKTIQ